MLETEYIVPEEADLRAENAFKTAFAAVRDDAPVLCIDVEASGVGPNTFPVEVALADPVSGSVRSWLIRPSPEWLTAGSWMPEAETLHGLSREQIVSDGLLLEQVAKDLDLAVSGARILSDAPQYDIAWLKTLYQATGADRPPFVLDDFQRFSWECAILTGRRPDIAMADAEAVARACFPVGHRAGADARRNAEILRQLVSPEEPAS